MSFVGDFFDKTKDEVKRGWNRGRKETSRGWNRFSSETRRAYNRAKRNTYDKVRAEINRSPYYKYVAAVIDPVSSVVTYFMPDIFRVFDPFMDYFKTGARYFGMTQTYQQDVAPVINKAGYEVGRFIGKNFDYNAFLTTAAAIAGTIYTGGLGIPYLYQLAWFGVQLGADIYFLDMLTQGSVSQGYTSTFYDAAVEIDDSISAWAYPHYEELYSWYPASIEWTESGSGGHLFNPTGVIEPWENMTNNGQELDYSGYLFNNFYESQNPADQSIGWAGGNFMELYEG